MLDRLRAAARQKLQGAVAEVVEAQLDRSEDRLEEQLAARHDESLGRLTKDLEDRLTAIEKRFTAVHDRLAEIEFRARRDIWYALDATAAQESAAYALKHFPKAPWFWHPHDTLRFALSKVNAPGLALEFGVATGTTLAIIAEALSAEHTVVGFDTFTGLPENWRTGFPAGTFSQRKAPDVPGAELVAGRFEDTLAEFLTGTDEQVAFLHIDSDLYSSAKTVLDLTGQRLASGAVVVFDEFFNFPGWQQHEFRAWAEFIACTGRAFDYLAYTGNNEQVAVRLH
ncbi:MAG: class I SAM-dependent methyltransferase [Mycobacteriaceae bacterium]|nr:class I SAM-dependent methyltransferase [Mycobacteriaceae bacterium]